jgi:hypothetical protein
MFPEYEKCNIRKEYTVIQIKIQNYLHLCDKKNNKFHNFYVDINCP